VVTGSAGFIGSHLVKALIEAGAEVFGFDTVTGEDIRRPILFSPAFLHADYVFHQAALHWRKCQEDPRLCFDVMVQGTFNVLEAASHYGVKHVVMASSAKVYGPPTFYSQAKLAGENLAKAFDVPVTILRYFNVYGPGQKEGVMAEWQKRIDAGLPLQVFGDPRIDLVHVDEVVRANLAALDGPPGTYDVRSGTETRLLDLAATLGPVEQLPA
jgi:UDP-glucose 4-epimerase